MPMSLSTIKTTKLKSLPPRTARRGRGTPESPTFTDKLRGVTPKSPLMVHVPPTEVRAMQQRISASVGRVNRENQQQGKKVQLGTYQAAGGYVVYAKA